MIKNHLEKNTVELWNCNPDIKFSEFISRFTKGTFKKLYDYVSLECRINQYNNPGKIIYQYNKGIFPRIDQAISDILKYIYTYFVKLEGFYRMKGILPKKSVKEDKLVFPFTRSFDKQSIVDAFNFLIKRGYVEEEAKQSFVDIFQVKPVDINKRVNWKKKQVVLADFIKGLGKYLPQSTDFFTIARGYFLFKDQELKSNFHNFATRASRGIHHDADILLKSLSDTDDK